MSRLARLWLYIHRMQSPHVIRATNASPKSLFVKWVVNNFIDLTSRSIYGNITEESEVKMACGPHMCRHAFDHKQR